MATSGPPDGQLTAMPWTAGLALLAAGVDVSASRDRQLARIRDAIDGEELPPDAVDALIADGWTELDDPEAG